MTQDTALQGARGTMPVVSVFAAGLAGSHPSASKNISFLRLRSHHETENKSRRLEEPVSELQRTTLLQEEQAWVAPLRVHSHMCVHTVLPIRGHQAL